jgi:opacity protein-like surface antigen
MHYKSFLLALPLLLIAFSVKADYYRHDNTGWYAGVLLGGSSTSAEVKEVFKQNGNAESNGIYGGINFSPSFGLEGALITTGDVSDDRENLVKANFFGLSLTPKLSYRFNQSFSVYAKFGLGYLSYQEEYSNTILFERDTEESWSGFGRAWGIGAQLDIVRGIKIRIGYEMLTGSLSSNDETYYRKIADLNAELKQLSLGIHYQF